MLNYLRKYHSAFLFIRVTFFIYMKKPTLRFFKLHKIKEIQSPQTLFHSPNP